MKIGIIESDNFSSKAIQLLSNFAEVEIFNQGQLIDFVSNKEVLFVRLNYSIDKTLLNKAKYLKYICSPTTGLNHIDTAYCLQNGIKIISLKGEKDFLETIRATPEHSLGLILALKRNYKQAFLNRNNHVWNRDPHRGYEIFGSKIGIIGLGRVGKILAGYLLQMGAEVGFYDINDHVEIEGGVRQRSITELIQKHETIVLCSSYIESNGIIIDCSEIDMMVGKYFINTARAELTNEAYLVELANKGFFKGIAVDVIQNEQSSQDQLALWLKATEYYNVIITPHIAGATFTSMHRTEEFIALQLEKIIV